MGARSDRRGKRRTFLEGLAVFTLASAACALASQIGALIAASALQAVGAALPKSCQLGQSLEFREELVTILARCESIGASPEALKNRLGPVFDSGVGRTNSNNFRVFSGGDTNRPSMDKASRVLAVLRKDESIPNDTCCSIHELSRGH